MGGDMSDMDIGGIGHHALGLSGWHELPLADPCRLIAMVTPQASDPWVSLDALVCLMLLVGLFVGCLFLLHGGIKDRKEAHLGRADNWRALQELADRHQARILQEVEHFMVRRRMDLEIDLNERSDDLTRTLQDGSAELTYRLGLEEDRTRERAHSLITRLDEALFELRQIGRANVRFLLERVGLADALEQLRWGLGSGGGMRFVLRTEGLWPEAERTDQLTLYHLVSDAVDSLLGRSGNDSYAIRLRLWSSRCLVHVENGTDTAGEAQWAWIGQRRLHALVARSNGTLATSRPTTGGRALLIDVPLGP